MPKELELLDRVEQMNAVVESYLKGAPVSAIMRQTGLKRVEVQAYIEEYKEIARNDQEVKDRAKEALHGADQHLSMLIKESWDIIENETDNKVKNVAIKNSADIEVKRVELLQKAGLYDDAALGDELAEMEEKQQVLVNILKEVTANCEHCKFEVARRLSKVTDKAEPVVIDVEVNSPSE